MDLLVVVFGVAAVIVLAIGVVIMMRAHSRTTTWTLGAGDTLRQPGGRGTSTVASERRSAVIGLTVLMIGFALLLTMALIVFVS
ncbi:MAG: hypothetical protein ABW040_11110 [Microbacteriaceae bacterium]